MTVYKIVAVLGASGFVGSHTIRALKARGHEVVTMPTPRLPATTAADAAHVATRHRVELDRLVSLFDRVDAVVNAAGNPDASSRSMPDLIAANAALPALAAAAATKAGVPRFVHVSSAVVQGRLPRLDASLQSDTFSDYARSKDLGEELVRATRTSSVVYRPPSVHGEDRRVTRMTARIAASPVASVARPGSSPTPQALIQNVADAVAFLAVSEEVPPSVVIHPWEQLTTSGLMAALGGRQPIELPRWFASLSVRLLTLLGRGVPTIAANARRVEMLWFGQAQDESWLTSVGWRPPAGIEAWRALGATATARSDRAS